MKWKNSRGVFENFVSDPSKKIILINDNDEKRMLFESCTLNGKNLQSDCGLAGLGCVGIYTQRASGD